MTHPIRALILFALLCVPATVVADPFYDSYERGLAAFKASDYPGARAEFVKAYDLRAEPLVLFNIAQCYRLEQDPEQAIVFYRRFLAESKIAQDLREEAQRHVDDLEAQQQARNAQRRIEADAGPKEQDGSTVTMPPSPPIERRPATHPVTDAPKPASAASSVEVERRRRVPTASKIALGIGGASAAGGIVLGILGKRAESKLQGDPNATQADADRVERYETAINVSWGIAAAATITSVIVYFVAPTYNSDRTSVVVAPDRSGGWVASVSASF